MNETIPAACPGRGNDLAGSLEHEIASPRFSPRCFGRDEESFQVVVNIGAQARRCGVETADLPLRDQAGEKVFGHLAGRAFFVAVRADKTADRPPENRARVDELFVPQGEIIRPRDGGEQRPGRSEKGIARSAVLWREHIGEGFVASGGGARQDIWCSVSGFERAMNPISLGGPRAAAGWVFFLAFPKDETRCTIKT